MSNKNMVGNNIEYWTEPGYKHKDYTNKSNKPSDFRQKGRVVDEWFHPLDTKQYLVQPDDEDQPVTVIPLRSIHRVLFALLLLGALTWTLS